MSKCLNVYERAKLLAYLEVRQLFEHKDGYGSFLVEANNV